MDFFICCAGLQCPDLYAEFSSHRYAEILRNLLEKILAVLTAPTISSTEYRGKGEMEAILSARFSSIIIRQIVNIGAKRANKSQKTCKIVKMFFITQNALAYGERCVCVAADSRLGIV